jgi:hypothetical protein
MLLLLRLNPETCGEKAARSLTTNQLRLLGTHARKVLLQRFGMEVRAASLAVLVL